MVKFNEVIVMGTKRQLTKNFEILFVVYRVKFLYENILCLYSLLYIFIVVIYIKNYGELIKKL